MIVEINYNNNKPEHKKLGIIWMVEIRPDTLLRIDIDLWQEYQANTNKQPLVEISKQQYRIDQQEAAIADNIESAYDSS